MAAVLSAAKDPNIDASKLATLVGLAERIQDRSAREEFYRAMNAAQQAMPRVKKRRDIINHKTNKVQSKYAPLEDVDEAIRPIYESHGFAVTFPGAKIRDGKTFYSARVMHRAGHVEDYEMPLALDISGSKNETQGGGSTMSYARRYLLKSIFNIIEEGEDTDGNGPAYLTDDQVIELRDLCRETGSAEAKFAAVYSAASIEQIPASMYRAAKGVLQERQKARRA